MTFAVLSLHYVVGFSHFEGLRSSVLTPHFSFVLLDAHLEGEFPLQTGTEDIILEQYVESAGKKTVKVFYILCEIAALIQCKFLNVAS